MTDLTKKTDPPQTTADAEAMRLVHGIDRTRADLSTTLAALEARLEPSVLRGQVGTELQNVEDRVRVVVRDQMDEAKTLVRGELNEAKTLVHGELIEAKTILRGELNEARKLLRVELNEAEHKVKTGLADARSAVKKDLNDAVTDAKKSVRAATLGKVEDLATNIGDKMNDTRDTLVDTIRNNPLPAALMGFGFAWLLMNRSSASRGAYPRARVGPSRERHGLRNDNLEEAGAAFRQAGAAAGDAAHQARDFLGDGVRQASESVSDTFHDASDRVGQVATRVSEKASVVAHKASDTASHLAHKASDAGTYAADGVRAGAKRAEQEFRGALRDNPVALGAAALTLGAVVGFALPRTEGEDTFMGEARDRVLDRAGEAAHDAVESVALLVERAPDGAKAQPANGMPSLGG